MRARSVLLGACLGGLAACGWIIGDRQTSLSDAPGPADSDAGDSPDASSLDAAGEAGEWEPSSLPGLALWLDGTSGLSMAPAGVVWRDRSGNQNDGTSVDGGATVGSSAIGGHSAAHFDGNGYLSVADSPSLQFGTGDYFIAIVARHTTETTGTWGYGILFTKQLSDYPFVGPVISANGALTGGYSIPCLLTETEYAKWIYTVGSGYNRGQPFLVTVHRATSAGQTTLSIRANADDDVEATNSIFEADVSAAHSPLYLGGTPSGQNLVGDIAEIVVVKGPISDVDRSNAERYLMTKYAL
jgi:hypothetical protein